MKHLNIFTLLLALISGSSLNAQSLLTPADNTSLVVEGLASNTVDITWTNIGQGFTYTWELDLVSGNFSSPIVALPSNNSGTDTMLTLSLGAINGVLEGAGVPLNQQAPLKWRVVSRTMSSVTNSNEFNINLTRGVTIDNFDLLTPADGFSATVEGDGSASIDITWESAGTGATYAWFLDVTGGSFNPGVVNKLSSNNMGMDTVLTLDFSTLNSVLAGAGIADGQTANLIWKVHAYGGSDSLPSTQTFAVNLTKGKVLEAFDLTFPNDGFSATIAGKSDNMIDITWDVSHPDATYEWYLDLATGDFSSPIVGPLASNNSGADTVLSLDWATLDEVLEDAGVTEGNTANLQWKVVASVGNGTRESSSAFAIDLTNGAVIEDFDLLTPMDGFSATIDNDANQTIDITWEDAGEGATYKWFLDLASGDFSNPLVNGLDANNMGLDTVLTLDFATIYSVLSNAGVSPGATGNLKWKVHAYAGTDSIASSDEFAIDLTRGVSVGIQEINDGKFSLYPNPASKSGVVYIQGIESAENVRVLNILGKEVQTSRLENGQFELNDLNEGLYFIQIDTQVKAVVVR